MNKDTLYDLFEEDRTVQQWRAIWTTYCIVNDLIPNTFEYDALLRQLYKDYWNKSGFSYESYDSMMGEYLC